MAYKSYQCGRSKTVKDDIKMKIIMSCGSHGHAHRVENASKRYCGRESIDAFSMKTETQTFENASKRTGEARRKDMKIFFI